MKYLLKLFFVIVLSAAGSNSAIAVKANGEINYVGVVSELYSGGYHARFRFRMKDSICNGVTIPSRWVTVKSGRMDGQYVHNQAAFRAAYNTLMTAFLSGKSIQVDNLPSCSSSDQTLNLWQSQIGMY